MEEKHLDQVFSTVIHNQEKFSNSSDFHANKKLFRLLRQCANKSEFTVLIAGANQGQSMVNILTECPEITLHGFEIQASERSKAVKATNKFRNAIIHSKGWSDKEDTNIKIGGSGGTAGFYDPQGQRGWKLSGETGETVRLDSWTRQNGIESTLFVLIDTEGHESKIIRGMGLENVENRKKFPCFQYELGGTWAKHDNRNGNDKWDQIKTAQYLENLGYSLFLVGSDKWLPITSEFFRCNNNPLILDEGYGPFIQGNALALHSEYVYRPLEHIIIQSNAYESSKA